MFVNFASAQKYQIIFYRNKSMRDQYVMFQIQKHFFYSDI